MAEHDQGLNMALHRALGCALDAATYINALQHSEAINPANVPQNLEAAKQALQSALYHLIAYETVEPMTRIGP